MAVLDLFKDEKAARTAFAVAGHVFDEIAGTELVLIDERHHTRGVFMHCEVCDGDFMYDTETKLVLGGNYDDPDIYIGGGCPGEPEDG